jgi:hypothetical protein
MRLGSSRFPVLVFPDFKRYSRYLHLGRRLVMSIRVLCKAPVVLAWLLVSLPAFAQTTGAITPGKANDPLAQEEPPPGGCMPIGITAAGETVFPYACKGFIEAHKGKPSPQASETRDEAEPSPSINAAAAPAVNAAAAPAVNATNATTAPAVNSATAAATAAVTAPSVNETNVPTVEEKAVAKPDEPAASRTDQAPAAKQRPTRRAAGAPPNCAQFRTFDSVTGMYRDFTGQTRPCVAK